jgi:glycerophosphoryl diester phosphodiesterase
MGTYWSSRLRSLFPDGVPDILNIGHRGAARYYPENTMISFQAAYRMQADMIELDVALSRDGIPVVIHDDLVDRTTNGTGLVSEFSVRELKQLDAGSWMHPVFAGEKIPTLREALLWAQDRIPINIEIKDTAIDDGEPASIVAKVVALVEELQMDHQVLISSFDPVILPQIRGLNAKLATGLLYDRKTQRKQSARKLTEQWGTDTFHCSQWEWLLKKESEQQPPTLVYTVNRLAMMRRLIRQGVVGLFTDYPDILHRLKRK